MTHRRDSILGPSAILGVAATVEAAGAGLPAPWLIGAVAAIGFAYFFDLIWPRTAATDPKL